MRRLILQMQTSVDGFVEADPPIAWQLWDWGAVIPWDKRLIDEFNRTVAASDTILLSRPMIDGGYLEHWAAAADAHPRDPDFAFARRVGDVEKIVITRSNTERSWPRTRVLRGPLGQTVRDLKSGSGGDIIAFGGTTFAAALAATGLVDEYQFYVNPIAAGSGRTVMSPGLKVELIAARPYACGIVVLRYAGAPINEMNEVGHE